MPKISSIEYEKRIFAIQGWIIEGVQSALIVRQIISSGWTNAEKECDKVRSAERMLKAARDKWISIEEANIEQKRKLRVDEMKQYKRKLQAKYQGTPAGIFACVAVDKEINKLENLYPSTKIEVTGKDGEPIKTQTEITKHEVVFKEFDS
jgi:hypothetical protein